MRTVPENIDEDATDRFPLHFLVKWESRDKRDLHFPNLDATLTTTDILRQTLQRQSEDNPGKEADAWRESAAISFADITIP